VLRASFAIVRIIDRGQIDIDIHVMKLVATLERNFGLDLADLLQKLMP
jgi:hypothetical protein